MGCCMSAPVPLCHVHSYQLEHRRSPQRVSTVKRINVDHLSNRHRQKCLKCHTNDYPMINAMAAERTVNNVKENKQVVQHCKDIEHKEKCEDEEDEYGRKSFTFPILVSSPEKDRL